MMRLKDNHRNKNLKNSTESSGLSITKGKSPNAADDYILEKLSKQFDGKDKYGKPVKEQSNFLKGMLFFIYLNRLF